VRQHRKIRRNEDNRKGKKIKTKGEIRGSGNEKIIGRRGEGRGK